MALKRYPMPLEDLRELASYVDRHELTLSVMNMELTEDGSVVVVEPDPTWKAVVKPDARP